MSVDHYDCAACGTTGIYEEYTGDTECCGQRICSRCCIGEPDDGNTDYIYGYTDRNHGEIRERHCPFCSGDKVSDRQVIDFLLNETGFTVDEVKRRILKERHGVQPPDYEWLKDTVKKHFPDANAFHISGAPMDGGMYLLEFDTDMETEKAFDAESALMREIDEKYPKLIIVSIG